MHRLFARQAVPREAARRPARCNAWSAGGVPREQSAGRAGGTAAVRGTEPLRISSREQPARRLKSQLEPSCHRRAAQALQNAMNVSSNVAADAMKAITYTRSGARGFVSFWLRPKDQHRKWRRLLSQSCCCVASRCLGRRHSLGTEGAFRCAGLLSRCGLPEVHSQGQARRIRDPRIRGRCDTSEHQKDASGELFEAWPVHTCGSRACCMLHDFCTVPDRFGRHVQGSLALCAACHRATIASCCGHCLAATCTNAIKLRWQCRSGCSRHR